MSFECAAERAAGLYGMSAMELRESYPETIRKKTEAQFGKPIRFVSEHPTIGRGNVLRDHMISSSEINADIDSLLSQK